MRSGVSEQYQDELVEAGWGEVPVPGLEVEGGHGAGFPGGVRFRGERKRRRQVRGYPPPHAGLWQPSWLLQLPLLLGSRQT